MKKLMIAAVALAGMAGSSAAFAAHYTHLYGTWSECRAAAKVATKAGETVYDCRLVDGGWTYDPPACQDGQCTPD
ncbi:exported hypothetical protein [Sphingomonas sp. EC-HK361]|uniref:hypothetical protein n=1 Tax=Sphingomonas sp. EC-HK361 TaxID=2038397 RepID=UPI0012553988|nr:hypothetical protein [Sphingomonas sp. EC-HK361]VVT19519.1 exported hypothetical protein [Sphingomonas sp. EC-HK361]